MAIALSKEKVQAEHGMMMIYSFIALMITNVVVLMIANFAFPQHVVLGTYSISYFWALYHSMLKLTLVSVFVMPLITYYEWKKKTILSPKAWMLTYFFVNFAMIWEITRFAENLGFGVTSWGVVLILAVVFDLVQGMVMMSIGKLIKL